MVNILLNFSDFFHSKPPFHIIIGKCQLSCGDMRQVKMRYKLRKKRCWAWQCIFPSTTTQKWKKTLRLTSKKKNLKKFSKIGHGTDLRTFPLQQKSCISESYPAKEPYLSVNSESLAYPPKVPQSQIAWSCFSSPLILLATAIVQTIHLDPHRVKKRLELL